MCALNNLEDVVKADRVIHLAAASTARRVNDHGADTCMRAGL